MATQTTPTMSNGYAYETVAYSDVQIPGYWRNSSDERWEIVVHTADGTERFVGTRRIDGTTVNVWLCSDGTFKAQVRFA
jgi:hypothetical protein